MKFSLTIAPSFLLVLLPLSAIAMPAPNADNGMPAAPEDNNMPAPPIDLTPRALTTCRVINADSEVKCRAGPGFDYAVRTHVYPNGIYDFSCYNTWQKVSFGTFSCYVNGYYTDSRCTAAALGKC
ncbi:hypothetical protein BDW75DRAFT_232995 [Aspergillus navahoensis]